MGLPYAALVAVCVIMMMIIIIIIVVVTCANTSYLLNSLALDRGQLVLDGFESLLLSAFLLPLLLLQLF